MRIQSNIHEGFNLPDTATPKGARVCGNTRRWVARSLVSIALLVSVGCSAVSDGARELIGRPVPDGRLMLLNGEHIALQGRKGTNMAILFWATWCAHSRSEIIRFEEIARRYQSRSDVEFFAVSLDKNEDLESLEGRINSQKLRSVIHVFSGNDTQDEAFLSLRGDQIPYAVFVDSRGIVRFVDLGAGGLEDFLAARFGD